MVPHCMPSTSTVELASFGLGFCISLAAIESYDHLAMPSKCTGSFKEFELPGP